MLDVRRCDAGLQSSRKTHAPAVSCRRAFTLIELLCVLAMMVFLMTVALGSSLGWGRASGLRGSVLEVKSSLALARQMALTHGTRCLFSFANTNRPVAAGYYVVATNDAHGIIGETNYLPKGFIFQTNALWFTEFQPDGTATGDTDIVVREVRGTNYLAATVTVVRSTGFIRTSE